MDTARLIDAHGVPISTRDEAGGVSIDAAEPRFNPLKLTEGRWSARSAPGRDRRRHRHQARLRGRRDDRCRRARPGPTVHISGIAEFRTLDSLGGLTLAMLDPPTAQAFFGKSGRFDEILVAAKEGVSPDELDRAIRPILPAGTEVVTGEAEVASQAKGTNEDIAVVWKFMLASGASPSRSRRSGALRRGSSGVGGVGAACQGAVRSAWPWIPSP